MAANLHEKNTRFELLKRSLGLKHKIKVQESLEAPKNHDELANYLLAKWELEDELHAIEAVLAEIRTQSTLDWKLKIESHGVAAIHTKSAEENGFEKSPSANKTNNSKPATKPKRRGDIDQSL